MRRTAFVVVLFAFLTMAVSSETVRFVNTVVFQSYVPMFNELFAEAGLQVTYTYVAIPRGIAMLKAGNADASCFLTDPLIAEIPGAIKILPPVSTTDIVAVTRDPKIKIRSPDDLAGLSVGYARGNATMEALARKGSSPNPVTYDEQVIRMLAAGRIEVALMGRVNVHSMATQAGMKDYYVQEPSLVKTPAFFVLTKSNASLEAKITPVIKRWVESGRFARELATIWDHLGEAAPTTN